MSYRSAAEIRLVPVDALSASSSARYAIKLERIHAVRLAAGFRQSRQSADGMWTKRRSSQSSTG